MTRKPRIEVFEGRYTRTGPVLWYWACRASNGNIVADGAEGYASKSNALRAARRFRDSFCAAHIEIRDMSK